MITTITTLIDLVMNFVQHPVESILIYGVIGVIIYVVAQKTKERTHHEADHE